MLLTTLLVATLSSVPAAPAPTFAADPSISITTAYAEGQQASRSELAARLGSPSDLTLSGGVAHLLPVASDANPYLPFDGAGISNDSKSILALLLGLLVGFGTGHLVAGDKSGFVLFLIIDIVLWAAQSSFYWAFNGVWYIGGLASLLLVISHIYQGLDAYGKASGEPIIEHVREKQIRISAAPGGREHPMTTRTFSLSF